MSSVGLESHHSSETAWRVSSWLSSGPYSRQLLVLTTLSNAAASHTLDYCAWNMCYLAFNIQCVSICSSQLSCCSFLTFLCWFLLIFLTFQVRAPGLSSVRTLSYLYPLARIFFYIYVIIYGHSLSYLDCCNSLLTDLLPFILDLHYVFLMMALEWFFPQICHITLTLCSESVNDFYHPQNKLKPYGGLQVLTPPDSILSLS